MPKPPVRHYGEPTGLVPFEWHYLWLFLLFVDLDTVVALSLILVKHHKSRILEFLPQNAPIMNGASAPHVPEVGLPLEVVVVDVEFADGLIKLRAQIVDLLLELVLRYAARKKPAPDIDAARTLLLLALVVRDSHTLGQLGHAAAFVLLNELARQTGNPSLVPPSFALDKGHHFLRSHTFVCLTLFAV